ncbi:unnamed protein product [Leptosia nina]|uniref:Uncharacterized protein n=1 Tax=Leptosia nina TaxID=320188 RepID=A0AAV1J3L9_9NEOP
MANQSRLASLQRTMAKLIPITMVSDAFRTHEQSDSVTLALVRFTVMREVSKCGRVFRLFFVEGRFLREINIMLLFLSLSIDSENLISFTSQPQLATVSNSID